MGNQIQILNFTHPLSEEQLQYFVEADRPVVTNIPVNIAVTEPLAPQITSIVNQVEWTSEDWQSRRFVVNLPGMALAAAALVAEIHGRCGFFPQALQLNRGGQGQGFYIHGIVDLQTIRDEARTRRF